MFCTVQKTKLIILTSSLGGAQHIFIMSDSIQMPGVVFMKYVIVNSAGVNIYVTHSAKTYEETPALMYNPMTDEMHYTDSVNRADSDVQYTGHWIEVKDSKFLRDNDKLAPMWLQTGFPIFNKQFNNVVTREEKRGSKVEKIYKVTSANLNNEEQAELLKRFRAKYPKYYGKIMKNYEAKVARGEYRSLAERILEFKNKKTGIKGKEKLFETLTGSSELPFTQSTLSRARMRQIQDWCKELNINYKDFGSVKAAKAALLEML